MVTLTVGYVSGIIAAAVFVIQYLLPNVLTLVLTHFLGDNLSAASWSVAGRELQSSAWPRILNTDANTSRGVSPSLKLLAKFNWLVFILVTLSAVITPLGLHEVTRPASQATSVKFSYAKDSRSDYAAGTKPRPSNFTLQRWCSGLPCPGTTGTGTSNSYDPRIPDDLFNVFQSGLASQKTTVSSIFDIQWREYLHTGRVATGIQNLYPFGKYSQLETRLPNEGVALAEGLIIDYSSGIGFRRHTIPASTTNDAEWEEDILFIEPDSSCTNSNLTLEWTVQETSRLKDHGGFVDLNQAPIPDNQYGNPQVDPEMDNRAYAATWWMNYVLMLYLNVTNPEPHTFQYLNSALNKSFPVEISPAVLPIKSIWIDSVPSDIAFVILSKEHPAHVNLEDIDNSTRICRGPGMKSIAGPDNIAVECGIMLTPQSLLVPGKQNILSKEWSRPMFGCATATRAVIKTVKFHYNASLCCGLEALSVLDIKDKRYKTRAEIPHWGIEKTHMQIQHANPIWGIVDEKKARQLGNNISIVQAERLYLPGYVTSTDWELESPQFPFSSRDNFPGSNFYMYMLGSLYDIVINPNSQYSPYTGVENAAIYRKWAQMSAAGNTTSVARILNLIWIDMAANAVFGTRGWTSHAVNSSGSSQSTLLQYKASQHVDVRLFESTVRIHWVYCIPAFLTIGLTVAVCLAGLACWMFGQGNPARVRYYLNRTSAGRLMAAVDEQDLNMANRDWAMQRGPTKVAIGTIPGFESHNVGQEPSEDVIVAEATSDEGDTTEDTKSQSTSEKAAEDSSFDSAGQHR